MTTVPAEPDLHMQRLLARRLSVLAMAGTGSSASALPQLERFERALSSVDIAVEPRVQLVPPAVGGGEWPLPLDESVAVLDSSFNPPTCAHVHLLRSAAARFGVRRRMLLLAKQNADKPVVGASLPHRLQMMELLAREEVEGSTVCVRRQSTIGLVGFQLYCSIKESTQSIKISLANGIVFVVMALRTSNLKTQ